MSIKNNYSNFLLFMQSADAGVMFDSVIVTFSLSTLSVNPVLLFLLNILPASH